MRSICFALKFILFPKNGIPRVLARMLDCLYLISISLLEKRQSTIKTRIAIEMVIAKVKSAKIHSIARMPTRMSQIPGWAEDWRILKLMWKIETYLAVRIEGQSV